MSTRSLNRVTLIGNLTRDPELKYTPQGSAVCTFGLATNREWTDSSGQKQEGVEFHRIVAWGKLGEICSQLLQKGSKTFVEGRLQTRAWKSQDGNDRQVTEIVIEEMMALGAPKGASQSNYEPVQSYVRNDSVTPPTPAEEVFSAEENKNPPAGGEATDEIPF